MEKLNNKLTYVKNYSSAEVILNDYIYEETLIGFFNKGQESINTNCRYFSLPSFNKATLNKKMFRNIDYYFLFDLTLNAEHLELISFLMSLERSIILVNCTFEERILKQYIDKDKIITYDKITFKENLENF